MRVPSLCCIVQFMVEPWWERLRVQNHMYYRADWKIKRSHLINSICCPTQLHHRNRHWRWEPDNIDILCVKDMVSKSGWHKLLILIKLRCMLCMALSKKSDFQITFPSNLWTQEQMCPEKNTTCIEPASKRCPLFTITASIKVFPNRKSTPDMAASKSFDPPESVTQNYSSKGNSIPEHLTHSISLSPSWEFKHRFSWIPRLVNSFGVIA